MENKIKICNECMSSMTPGFVIDIASKSAYQLMWHEGLPEDIIENGFVKKFEELDHNNIAFVKTFRCPKCGLLKSYGYFEKPEP